MYNNKSTLKKHGTVAHRVVERINSYSIDTKVAAVVGGFILGASFGHKNEVFAELVILGVGTIGYRHPIDSEDSCLDEKKLSNTDHAAQTRQGGESFVVTEFPIIDLTGNDFPDVR